MSIDEEIIENNNLNKTRFCIGSIKNRRIKYDRDECFFNKNDIPKEKLEIHEEINNFIDPDYLGYYK